MFTNLESYLLKCIQTETTNEIVTEDVIGDNGRCRTRGEVFISC